MTPHARPAGRPQPTRHAALVGASLGILGVAIVGVAAGALAATPAALAGERPVSQLAQADDFGSGTQGQVMLKQPLVAPEAADATASTRTVAVTGVGTSPDEARRDAARQAVQQVVGLYIDARRQVESHITDQAVSTIVREDILS